MPRKQQGGFSLKRFVPQIMLNAYRDTSSFFSKKIYEYKGLEVPPSVIPDVTSQPINNMKGGTLRKQRKSRKKRKSLRRRKSRKHNK